MSATDQHSGEQPGVAMARGVCRMLAQRSFASLTEFATRDGLRMDVCALGRKGEIWCVEVKSSRADFLSDRKWEGYLGWCDRFFFAVSESFPDEILPFEHGLIHADAYGGEILRWARRRNWRRRGARRLRCSLRARQRSECRCCRTRGRVGLSRLVATPSLALPPEGKGDCVVLG